MQIIVDNLYIYYQDEGSGPIALLLHGWASDLTTFNSLTQALKTHYRVISLDLPGFGNSQIPNVNWHIQDYARFIRHFLDQLNIKNPELLIAHSFGARISLRLLSHELIKPQSTFLLGPAGLKHSNQTKNLLLKIIAKIGKHIFTLPLLSKLAPKLKKQLYTHLNSTDYLFAGPMRNIFLNTINEDLTKDALQINLVVHFIWGKNDTTVPPETESALAQACPHSTIHLIDNAGHFVHQDQFQTVLDLINKFSHV